MIFTLKKIKLGRAGTDDITIETYKCLRNVGVSWLMNFFNKIIVTKKMLDEWRKNILVPVYKNKRDIQSCTNYMSIKLMCHTMKLWERVIEQRLRHETTISANQFGFMLGRSIMEAIYLLRRLMKMYRD